MFADWSNIKCVCLDVDSTVCEDEGLDEIAGFLGVTDKVEKITEEAMNGELDITKALEARLSIMNLNLKKLTDFLDNHPVRLTPGVENLVNQFKENGVDVYLVSGGLYPLVNRVAKLLNIPEENVYANKLIFNNEGTFVGLDHSAPTSRSDGKALIVNELLNKLHTPVMMIGDGMTDANACPPASVFIGFGVNVIRPKVKTISDYFCTSVEELINLLKNHKMLL
ncbi:unnamed protein product [Schistosoma curassoni]|uniref:Phosphoserine phosphatase n=1 Tax=Schistosoma curassoni TaxID=6186 RepID=A0A183KEB4_9TREM|nr:unnamed protein product [Schistosoma curassoni]VDP52343.1 unnamed protein product [Schistosoma curassoni]